MAEVVIDGGRPERDGRASRPAAAIRVCGFYGRNLAALRDRLLADVPRPFRIVWLSSRRSRERLGEPLFSSIVGVFQGAAQQDLDFGWADRFEFELR